MLNQEIPQASVDNSSPQASIRGQVSGTDILSGLPSVLVDDPNYLVDDSRAGVGSITVLTGNRQLSGSVDNPKSSLSIDSPKGTLTVDTPSVS